MTPSVRTLQGSKTKGFQGSTPLCPRGSNTRGFSTADENGWLFDELIQEKRGTTYWVHFAVRPKNNRRKILFDCR